MLICGSGDVKALRCNRTPRANPNIVEDSRLTQLRPELRRHALHCLMRKTDCPPDVYNGISPYAATSEAMDAESACDIAIGPLLSKAMCSASTMGTNVLLAKKGQTAGEQYYQSSIRPGKHRRMTKSSPGIPASREGSLGVTLCAQGVS